MSLVGLQRPSCDVRDMSVSPLTTDVRSAGRDGQDDVGPSHDSAARPEAAEKVTHRSSSPRQHYTVENGRIVAACRDQYEAMPDRVLKS